MKAVLRFIKTTVVGGIMFLIPVIVLVVLLAKALKFLSGALHPIAQLVPTHSVFGVAIADILAGVVLVAVGFVAGLIGRTTFGVGLSSTAENLILRKLPGYTLIKSVAHGSLGVGDESSVVVVLAHIDEGWMLAFLMEELANGLRTVFVPSAPTPAAGSIYYLTEQQIRRLDVTVAEAVKCIMQLGVGSQELLGRAMPSSLAPTAAAQAPR